MALDRQTLRAIQKYGPSVSAVARRYGLSGSALLAKLVTGESGGNPNAVSSAGARGLAQFTAGSRQVAIQKYGIDPWASPDQALHAASLHLRGKINGQQGLGGYNPGDPSYAKYILGQKVGNVGGSKVIGGSQPNASGNTDVVTQSGTGFSPGQVTALQQALQSAKPQVQITAPQAPSFSASVPLPKGYQSPTMPSLQPSSGPSLSEQLASVTQQGGQTLPNITTTTTSGSSGGGLTTAGSGPDSVRKMFEAAVKIDGAHVPYQWGGGHGGRQSQNSKVTPLDCSGAVSRVLGINPLVSGDLAKWGAPGRGRNVTIYANGTHTFMEINGHFFGTSHANPGGGAGWIPKSAIAPGYLKGFTARHPPGL